MRNIIDLKLLQYICGGKLVIANYLAPKGDIYNKTINGNGFSLNGYNLTQEIGKNFYFVINEYTENTRKEKNLENIHALMFDIDIGKYGCNSEEDFLNSLENLKSSYGLVPHLVVKTRNGYHTYFCFHKISYKTYKKEINSFYTKICNFLKADPNYRFTVGLGKIPYSTDFSYGDIFKIEPIKINSHRKYKITDLIEVFKNIDNNGDNIYFKFVNGVCAKKIFTLLGIKIKGGKLESDRSIGIGYNKQDDIYYIQDFSGRIKSMYHFLLEHFNNDYKKLYDFINNDLEFSGYITKNKNVKIDKLLLDQIINGFYVDFEKLSEIKFTENDLITKFGFVKQTNGKFFSTHVNYLFLSLLAISTRNGSNYGFEINDIEYYKIFSNSLLTEANLRTQKSLFLDLFKIMTTIYFEITSYKINDKYLISESNKYIKNNQIIYIVNKYKTDDKIFNFELLNNYFKVGNYLKNKSFSFSKKYYSLGIKYMTLILYIRFKSKEKSHKLNTMYELMGLKYNINIHDKIFSNFKVKYYPKLKPFILKDLMKSGDGKISLI